MSLSARQAADKFNLSSSSENLSAAAHYFLNENFAEILPEMIGRFPQNNQDSTFDTISQEAVAFGQGCKFGPDWLQIDCRDFSCLLKEEVLDTGFTKIHCSNYKLRLHITGQVFPAEWPTYTRFPLPAVLACLQDYIDNWNAEWAVLQKELETVRIKNAKYAKLRQISRLRLRPLLEELTKKNHLEYKLQEGFDYLLLTVTKPGICTMQARLDITDLSSFPEIFNKLQQGLDTASALEPEIRFLTTLIDKK